MEQLKDQIRQESSEAAQLSQQAMAAFANKDFTTGKALMQQATEASRNCRNLIDRYKQIQVTTR